MTGLEAGMTQIMVLRRARVVVTGIHSFAEWLWLEVGIYVRRKRTGNGL